MLSERETYVIILGGGEGGRGKRGCERGKEGDRKLEENKRDIW